MTSEEEERRIEDLLGLWKYVGDIRAHEDFYAGVEPRDELDAAIADLDFNIESVFEQLDELEEIELKSLPAGVAEKKRRRERKLLRASALREIERLRRDPDRGRYEVADLGTVHSYLAHVDPPHVGEEVGFKCRICGGTWPTTGLEPICTCTEALAHRQCLAERLRARCETKCELCGKQYDLDWRPHYDVLHGLRTWILQNAGKVDLLLVVLLVVLVVTKTILLGEFIVSSTRSVLDARAGDNSTAAGGTAGDAPGGTRATGDVPEGTRTTGDAWGVAKECWRHMVVRTDMPAWFLPLAVCVLLMHLGLAVILAVKSVKSFRFWYCREARVSFREE